MNDGFPREPASPEDEAAFSAFLANKEATVRDLDLDAFADGIVAHREGKEFHENPHGANRATIQRLSWHMGWNERALKQRD